MKAVSVHEDAIVVTSLMWQTTTTAIRAGGETMLIDSPYFPDELELLPTVLAQSGFEPTALLATHGDFDHLLAPFAFPGMSLGVAESTMARIRAKPGEAQRDLRDEDSDTYVVRPGPLAPGPDAVAAGARQARPGGGGAGAAPDRRARGGRDGDLRAVAGRAVRGRLRVRRRDPVDARERRPGGLPRNARAAGRPGGAGGRGGARPRHPAHRASARWS